MIKNFEKFINENIIDYKNNWAVINKKSNSILNRWELLEDAFIDGLCEVIAEEKTLDDEFEKSREEFYEIYDKIIEWFPSIDEEDITSEEIDEFIKEELDYNGDYTIRRITDIK